MEGPFRGRQARKNGVTLARSRRPGHALRAVLHGETAPWAERPEQGSFPGRLSGRKVTV